MEKDRAVNRSILLSIIVLTSFINPFLGTAVTIALPQISKEFAMNAITMSWISMSFLLSAAVFMVPLGKASDIVGRKRIFITGNIIMVAATLLCLFSLSSTMLIVARFIQGFGSAMVAGTGMAIITSAFPPHERGKAIGINVSAVYLGLSLAPLIGGFLTQTFGWRSIFFITIPIGLAVAVLTYAFIKKEWTEACHERFDFWGAIIYVAAMSMFMYGFSKLPDLHAIGLAILGLAGILLFIRMELGTEYPVLEIKLFKNNKIFAFSNLAALINYAATFAITFILSLYLQYIKGLPPRDAGILLVTQPALMAIVASFAGRLSDKYDSRILSSLGMSIIVIGLILLSFLGENTVVPYIIMSLIILGIGFGLFSSPNTNAVMGSVDKKYLGVASATVGTMRLTGQMMSMGIATLVLHIFIGEAKIVKSNSHLFLVSLQLVFVLFSILCTLGVFASLARGKREANNS